MADASIIDIGGVQWNVKDKDARDRITVMEDLLTVKDLPNLTINRGAGYSWTSLQLYNHYSFGKIHFPQLIKLMLPKQLFFIIGVSENVFVRFSGADDLGYNI